MWEKIPGPLPLFLTASNGKLGGAWEQGLEWYLVSEQLQEFCSASPEGNGNEIMSSMQQNWKFYTVATATTLHGMHVQMWAPELTMLYLCGF